MKRKSLLFLLLIALFAPLAVNAYNHQVQVGTGTSGQNIAPINLYYNYSYTQQIYTAAQINGDCSLPGDIESISFYYAGSVTKTHPITVFMKTTEKTSFSSTSDWETVTESDIVYNDSWTVSTAGWVTITLNEPFAYDGESNLLIAIDKGYGDSYSNQSFRYTAVTNNQVIHYRSDSTDPNPYSPTTASGTSKNLPNIQFNMTIAHPAPSALTLDEVVINTATISWTAPQTTNTITGYAYEYTDSNDVFTGTTTGTTANLTELTAATDYLFEVKAIYSDGESCWSEALDFTTLEACMTPENLTITNVTAHTADLTWTEGFGDGQWVLKYKLSAEEEYTNSVNVALADLPYTLTGLTAESTYNVQISPVCDDTKTLTGNFTTTVACFAPTNLAVEANVQTATFTWESDVNDYEIAHATVATADPIDNIVGTATDTVYSMSDLTIDTDHYFWVRSNCGSEGYSAWAGPVSVHIGYCVPNPTSHDGSGITGVSFGTGDYVVTNGDGTASLPASAPYYGDYSSMIGAVQAGVESTIAITTSTGNYPYTFVIWVDFDNSLSFEDSEILYVGKATSGAGTLNATITVPATQTLGDYRMRIYGADSYFNSFYNNGNPDYTKPHDPCSSGSYRHAHDYTLRVLEAPSCLPPTDLTVSDVTAHEADLTWTENGEATAWIVEFGTDPEFTSVLVENVEDEPSLHFQGLAAETTYYVRVKAVCSPGNESDYSSNTSFTTTIACPAPTGLAFTLTPGDGTVATFSWTENGSATAWQLCINGDEDNLIDMDENPFTYNGFTPEETYTAKVRAVCGGIDGESAWSNTVTFTPTDAYMLTVNDGTNTHNYVPFYGYYADSDANSQFIIPASALTDMQWGTINKITFYGGTASATWNGAVFDVYFSEVSNTEFESAALVDWSELDSKVYTGSVSVVGNKMELTLTTPYQYMGGNLLIGFDETTNSSNYPSMGWYGVTQTNNTAVYKYSSNAAALAKFLPKVTFDYEPGEEPSCFKPANLAVNYEGGITATVTWEGETETYNIDVNGTVTEGVTSPYTLEGLELATTYAVMVQANCGTNGTSEWTSAVSFTTDLCMPEDQCEISFELTDSYGDGWNGAYIEVVDVATGESLAQMSNQNIAKGEETETYTLAVCDGREIQFVWVSGSYDTECSYVVYDINEEVIFEGSGAMSEPVNYTVNCTPITCFRPTEVEVDYITNDAATVQWNGTSTSYEVQYRTAETTQIIPLEGSYYYDFEHGIDEWTVYQEGEAGGNWAITNPSSWSSSSQTYAAHSGTYCVMARSWSNNVAFNADNWLVTPQVTFPATMSYWVMGDASYPETYDICVSTTGNAVADFTMVVSYDTNPNDWTLVTVDLSAYEGQTGYIAFHQYGNDNDFLWIDDVVIGEAEETLIPAGEWMTVETANLAAELTELAANTTYDYQVRGFCDADSTYSAWTNEASFTTLDICATPENLNIVSGANSAILTWEGVQEQYVLLWVDAAGTSTIQSAEVTGTYYEITGLESGVEYLVNVIGICSATQQSGTIDGTFTTALLWTDPETWAQVPDYNGDPEQTSAPEVINVPENMTVVIPENTVVTVNQIDLPANSEIIIEEGGELAYTVDDPTDPNAAAQGIDVTMSMTITPSGAKSGTDYRLIASPIYQTIDVVDCGLTENYYGMDLYSFDASYPGAEWRNYKTNDNFDNLEIGKGYLYYNSESVFVTFYGQTVPSNVIYPIALNWSDNAQIDEWKGLNLVGNPFTCKAVPMNSLNQVKPFYVMNGTGSEIIAASDASVDYVAPMRGFFVVAENASDVCYMNKYTGSTKSALNMSVNQNDDLVDVAVVNFSKGENLRKVQLNPNHTKVYMPVEGNDYAVANAESNAGEMPVNFKAEHNGSYTLNFGIDNVNFNYLHLIDNMTGADVDLLATPYYTFNANSTDYASRFKLVYATGDNSNDDNFAFFNNGNIIINNDGEATLQVVDVMGRILKSESINGSTSVNLNVAPGVYMLRLINGNDVKVQKIVVR